MSSPQGSPHTNIPSLIKFIPYSKPSTPLKISIPFINLTPELKAALPIIDLCTLSLTPSDMSPFIDLCTLANSPVEAPLNSPALSSAPQKGPPPPIPTTPHPCIHFQESTIQITVSNPPDFDVTTGNTVAHITQTSTSPSPPQSCSPKINYEKLAAKNLAAKKHPDGSYGGQVVTQGNLMGVFDKSYHKEDMLKSMQGFMWAVIKRFADEFNALLMWESAWKDHLIGRNAGPDKFPDPMQNLQ
ncbi:hypothetical protein ARMGADRAFT_1022959 [Armillaria gallica]|uniref:Uncharacterized protein n=1 Tax=Armillaria gallica TaxID=47427 RepID=A0A2H3EQ41_ARMGA|nr:hypothetical protein ARMGADRAFT_1022959 [Armillaria gallica]